MQNIPQFDNNYIMAIRHRVRVQNDENNPDEESRTQRRVRKSVRPTSVGKVFLIAVLMSLSGAIYLGAVIRHHHHRSTLSSTSATGNVTSPDLKSKVIHTTPSAPKDWSDYCHDNPPQPNANTNPVTNKKVEPLWLPVYPTSLPGERGDAYTQFLAALTGVPAAAKNFYRSSKALKRCHSRANENNNVDGVTCEIVHPIIPCQRPHPSAQSGNFGSVILLALRNPITAFPAFHQEKAVLYHGVKGQVGKEVWIKFRDEFVGNTIDNSTMFNEWKNLIMEWRDMNPYHVEEYLPYEHWSDETKGPALVTRLAQILKREGFPVLYDDEVEGNMSRDLECLWHKHIRETSIAEEKKKLEEGWYAPDYTKEQLKMMTSGLQTFAQEIKQKELIEDEKNGKRPGDEQLVAILTGYSDAILESM